MTKSDFVKTLREHGYNAENENGCVMVTTSNKGDFRKVQKIAKEADYEQSFGWRLANDSKVSEV